MQKLFVCSVKVLLLQSKKTQADQNRALIDILPKRGPKAFQIFIESLVSSGQAHIANRLDPSIPLSAGPISPSPDESLNPEKSGNKSFDRNGSLPSQPVSIAGPGFKSGGNRSCPQPVSVVKPIGSGQSSKGPVAGPSGEPAPSSLGESYMSIIYFLCHSVRSFDSLKKIYSSPKPLLKFD